MPDDENSQEPKIIGQCTGWTNGIIVQTYELNNAERSYVFPKSIVCERSGFLDFWGGVDKYGAGPEGYGRNISQFIRDLFEVDITGLYAAGKVVTIFINKSGKLHQPKWEDIEPKIKLLMEKYLLS
jgi:hypothetical protein